jgi:hypothetical protein
MKIKEGFVLRQVCGEWVVVGEGLSAINFNRLLSLNDTAAWLWQQAMEQGDFTVDSLADRLSEEYDVTTEDARRDVAELVGKWQQEGIVA